MRVEASARQAVRQDWTALDSTGEAVAGAVAASALLRAQRTHADGTTGLQPVVPLVRGSEHGRPGLGCDGVHQEPSAAPRRRCCRRFLCCRAEAGTLAGLALR